MPDSRTLIVADATRELLSPNQDNVLFTHNNFITSLVSRITSCPVVLADLPSSDPHVAGQIWNSAGVPTISAG